MTTAPSPPLPLFSFSSFASSSPLLCALPHASQSELRPHHIFMHAARSLFC